MALLRFFRSCLIESKAYAAQYLVARIIISEAKGPAVLHFQVARINPHLYAGLPLDGRVKIHVARCRMASMHASNRTDKRPSFAVIYTQSSVRYICIIVIYKPRASIKYMQGCCVVCKSIFNQ